MGLPLQSEEPHAPLGVAFIRQLVFQRVTFARPVRSEVLFNNNIARRTSLLQSEIPPTPLLIHCQKNISQASSPQWEITLAVPNAGYGGPIGCPTACITGCRRMDQSLSCSRQVFDNDVACPRMPASRRYSRQDDNSWACCDVAPKRNGHCWVLPVAAL